MKYDMRPMGTHPHEWFMFHGAQFGYKHANYMALENWVNVYDGDLGTALSDTYTSDSFLSNFSGSRQSCLTVYVVIPAMNTNL